MSQSAGVDRVKEEQRGQCPSKLLRPRTLLRGCFSKVFIMAAHLAPKKCVCDGPGQGHSLVNYV